MGYPGAWVIARREDATEDSVIVGAVRRGAVADADWVRFELQQTDDMWAVFERQVTAIGAELGGASIGAWVDDSDYAYVAAADSDRLVVRLIVGRSTARTRGHFIPGYSQSEAVSAFVTWSARYAPRTPARTDVDALLEGDRRYAEETAERIIDLAGLGTAYPEPSAAGGVPIREIGASKLRMYEAALPWMKPEFGVGALRMRWVDARFVLGMGPDFIGVWDREHPGGPLERFPRTVTGATAARERWQGLMGAQAKAIVGAADLIDFQGLHALSDGIDVAGRKMLWSDAPYILGRTARGLAIWERVSGRILESFSDDDKGEATALRHVRRLLLASVLTSRAVAAGDRAVAVAPDRWGRTGRRTVLVIVNEDADESWIPPSGAAAGTHVYELGGTSRAPSPAFMGAWSSLRRAKRFANEYTEGQRARWLEVPNEVPATLYETFRWALSRASETQTDVGH